MKIHKKEPAGDILVFLTGVEEVDNCVSYLKEEAASLKKNEGCFMLFVVLLLLHITVTSAIGGLLALYFCNLQVSFFPTFDPGAVHTVKLKQ